MGKKWALSEIEYLNHCVENSGTWAEATKLFRRRFNRSYDSVKFKAKSLGLHLIQLSTDEKLEITKLKNQINGLRSELKEAHKLAHTDQKLVDIITEVKGSKFDKSPGWTVKKRSAAMHGVPTLFLSDWHFDEFVYKDQVNGLNEFNHDIAVARANHTFETATDILLNRYSKPKYDGIHVAINGDMLSGNIHEELRETNCQPIMKSVYDLTNVLISNINNLHKAFGKVFLTCSVGNHGRIDRKPRAKNRVFDNYEYIVLLFVAKYFNGNPDVTFMIPDAAEMYYEIMGRRFLQTHGDVFRGGNGIGGILVPILRGFAKKQQIYAGVGKPIDTMIIGHFHQYIHLNNLVVNGSLKGVDEWCLQSGLVNDKDPVQALWINNPDHGMVHRTPIICNSYEGSQ